MRGIEESCLAFVSMRAVHLFLRARALISFLMRVASALEITLANLYCKTIIRFFPSIRKNIQHFHLISLPDLTLHTETNDDH